MQRKEISPAVKKALINVINGKSSTRQAWLNLKEKEQEYMSLTTFNKIASIALEMKKIIDILNVSLAKNDDELRNSIKILVEELEKALFKSIN